jgi:glycosyltransferase involved in cell wall biosynthesis
MPKTILFFADRLPPLIGGVEMHAKYFIEHFSYHPRLSIVGTITKNALGEDCLVVGNSLQPVLIENSCLLPNPDIVFFNSGKWIEQFTRIREKFPKALFIYRTGGNEILKAPLVHKQIPSHALRQSYWAHTINQTIDIMITNSTYTEKRLQKIGITCFFQRCVGGVNSFALKTPKLPKNELPVIFCAARFVHYKNHNLMVSVIKELVERGHKFHVRLAGDGPLLSKVQEQVKNDQLTSVITFLGAIDNQEVCREITLANIYMQLSSDHEIQVPGGSYIHSEGMGRSILEALTAGVFVIVGQSGALSEIVTKDKGLIVEPNHYKLVADQVEPILSSLPKRRPFSNDYSWTNIFRRYEDFMESSK